MERNASIFIGDRKGDGEEGREFPCNGKTNAVALLLAAVGFIIPVEPFKEFFEIHAFAILIVVGHRKDDGVFLSFRSGKGDSSLIIAVFHCIVQKDMKEFGEELFIIPYSEIPFILNGQRLSLIFGKEIKFIFCLIQDGFDGNVPELELRFCGFSCFGKEDEMIDEGRHAVYLLQDAFGPLILPVNHFHGFCIYRNNGQRRFQFMAGIGDEPLLIVQIFDKGGDGFLGKEGKDDDVKDDAHHAEPYRIGPEGTDVRKFSGAVQDDDKSAAVMKGTLHVSVLCLILLDEAGIGRGEEYVFCKINGFLFRESDDVLDVDSCNLACIIDADGEIPCLIGKFRCFFRPADTREELFYPEFITWRTEAERHGASIPCDVIHGFHAVIPHAVISHEIDEPESPADNHENGKGGKKNELPS